MSNTVLVIGPSGTGKSTSIRNLDHKSTFIISVLDKPLPMRGFKKKYVSFVDNNNEGNFYQTDSWERILKCLAFINENRNDIGTIIIDDFVYLMANEFMHRASETGYNKFSEIAYHAWLVINEATSLRDDLTCFILSHSEIDEMGRSRPKTIGKMLDSAICLEGLFTCVLHTKIVDGQYKFITQNDGQHMAKSPMGLFQDNMIDNDLVYVKKQIEEYYN